MIVSNELSWYIALYYTQVENRQRAPAGQLTLKGDSEAKIPKGPKIKENYLKSDKPEPSEKALEPRWSQSK